MKQKFSTLKERTVTDIVPFTKEQFIEMMSSQKPKEIFNGEWSERYPFIVIVEYNESGIKFYCNGRADKTPEQKTIEQLYDWLKYQGLSESYIVTDVLVEKI